MADNARKVNSVIDRFVRAVNTGHREPKLDMELPLSLRVAESDHGFFDWHIGPHAEINWIEGVEEKLPHPFPPSFRSLVTRYCFPSFAIGPLLLFANTVEGTYLELRTTIFADRLLSSVLLAAGLIQFGRPADGSYDPICFDARRVRPDGESLIVRIDHESILCREKIAVKSTLARSFAECARAIT